MNCINQVSAFTHPATRKLFNPNFIGQVVTIYNKDPQLYDAIYGGDDAESFSFVTWLLDELAISVEDKILDLGAGTGSILIPLTEMGYHIKGMEPFQPMLDYANIKARQHGIEINIEQGSFQSLEANNVFDLILAVNGPLHYVPPEELEISMENIHHALRDNGFVLIDLINFYSIIKNYEYPEPLEFEIYGNPATAMIQHNVDLDHEKWINRVVLYFKDQEYQRYVDEQIMNMYTMTHLDMVCKRYGLTRYAMYSSYQDRPDERVYGGRLLLIYQKT